MITISPADIDMGIRLLAAVALGGMIGMERETHGKDAGFRTYALVSAGSALMMFVSIQMYEVFKATGTMVDPSRISAQVVSGIGFLGAGAIIRSPQKITGLTTAAGIWATAGVGLACGLGLYRPAILTTILVLLILYVFPKMNSRLFGAKDTEAKN